MTDIRFKEMQDAGELISEEAFAELSEDAQMLMEKVLVMDEKGETPMGWMFRFKSEDDEEETDADEEEAAEEEADEEEAAEEEADEDDELMKKTMRPKKTTILRKLTKRKPTKTTMM